MILEKLYGVLCSREESHRLIKRVVSQVYK